MHLVIILFVSETLIIVYIRKWYLKLEDTELNYKMPYLAIYFQSWRYKANIILKDDNVS